MLMKKTIKNVVFTFLILSFGISFVQATGGDPDKLICQQCGYHPRRCKTDL